MYSNLHPSTEWTKSQIRRVDEIATDAKGLKHEFKLRMCKFSMNNPLVMDFSICTI